MSAAQRLDAADGVIDGKFFGRQIVQQGAPQQFVGGFPQQFGAAPAFGGFQTVGAFPQTFGATQFGGSSAAAALDAADGVIDGRHFGRPIVQAGAPQFATQQFVGGFPQTFGAAPAFGGFQTVGGFPQTFGATQFGGSSAAAALDAADGVIDGRHFGRPIVQAGAAPVAFGGFQTVGAYPSVAARPAFGTTLNYGTQFGGFPQQAFGTQFGGATSAAAALDAADGVIDGRHFGRPIVQAGAPQFATQQFVGGFPQQFGAPIAGGFPQTFGATQFGAPVFQQGGFQQAGGAAARLDAADGVIDGKFFGRPIVRA